MQVFLPQGLISNWNDKSVQTYATNDCETVGNVLELVRSKWPQVSNWELCLPRLRAVSLRVSSSSASKEQLDAKARRRGMGRGVYV